MVLLLLSRHSYCRTQKKSDSKTVYQTEHGNRHFDLHRPVHASLFYTIYHHINAITIDVGMKLLCTLHLHCWAALLVAPIIFRSNAEILTKHCYYFASVQMEAEYIHGNFVNLEWKMLNQIPAKSYNAHAYGIDNRHSWCRYYGTLGTVFSVTFWQMHAFIMHSAVYKFSLQMDTKTQMCCHHGNSFPLAQQSKTNLSSTVLWTKTMNIIKI